MKTLSKLDWMGIINNDQFCIGITIILILQWVKRIIQTIKIFELTVCCIRSTNVYEFKTFYAIEYFICNLHNYCTYILGSLFVPILIINTSYIYASALLWYLQKSNCTDGCFELFLSLHLWIQLQQIQTSTN